MWEMRRIQLSLSNPQVLESPSAQLHVIRKPSLPQVIKLKLVRLYTRVIGARETSGPDPILGIIGDRLCGGVEAEDTLEHALLAMRCFRKW